jgi:hypothetical protein
MRCPERHGPQLRHLRGLFEGPGIQQQKMSPGALGAADLAFDQPAPFRLAVTFLRVDNGGSHESSRRHTEPGYNSTAGVPVARTRLRDGLHHLVDVRPLSHILSSRCDRCRTFLHWSERQR